MEGSAPKIHPLYLICNLESWQEWQAWLLPFCEAGLSMIQLRGKDLTSREFFRIAQKIKEMVQPWAPTLIVNDRMDIALAIGADGVHLGQEDMPLPEARKILGDSFILGKTAKTLEDIQEGEEEGAHYLGIGSAFPSLTKPKAIPTPPSKIISLAQKTCLPVYAVGGIHRANFGQVYTSKIYGVALSSGIFRAPNPLEELKWFLKQLDHKKKPP